jgi:hypothetical protein
VNQPPLAKLVPPGGGGRYAGLSRGQLIFLATVVMGVLVIAAVRDRPDLSRRDKLLIVSLGCLQTLAAAVVLVFFTVWIFGWASRQLS